MHGGDEYIRTVLRARARGHVLSRNAVQQVRASLHKALRDLPTGSSRPLTREVADAMRTRIRTVLRGLEETTAAGTTRAVRVTITDIVKMHAGANAKLFAANGLETGAITARFGNLATRALSAIGSRSRNAATFRTLINRHMQDAAPALDQILTAGVARGVTARKLADDVASLLRGNHPSLREYGLRVDDLSGLRTVESDAMRIALSETNNAMREANAMAMRASPVVKAAQWVLSGNHSQECGCEDIAEEDVGFGPGYYAPEDWPVAPHPNCACYAGDVLFTPVEEWQ